jgi:anti-sigma B factor antagonist
MTSGFAADLSSGDGFVVLTLSGELDLAEAPVLRKMLDRVLRGNAALIVIDAGGLQFIDSTGIGVLVAARNHIEAASGLLVIANLDETVGRPVRLTEVDTAIPVHWAGTPQRPWTDEGATPVSILAVLGFPDEAAALGATLDVGAEPIG